jgi:DNA polymerase-3 subunit epsilon
MFYVFYIYNIENKNAHRADSDTLATAKLFLILKDEL